MRSTTGILAAYVIAVGVVGCSNPFGGDDSDNTLDPIIDELASVCAGEGVDHAGQHDPSEISPVLIMESSGGNGRKFGWSHSLPKEWWPQSAEATRLVACVSSEEKRHLQECSYAREDGSVFNVNRWRFVRDVTLRDARTAFVLEWGEIQGEDPAECAASYNSVRNLPPVLEGRKTKVSAAEEWLRPFVLP